MRVAAICGDKYHPAEVVVEGLTALGAGDIAWDFITDTTDWSEERMAGYDMFVLSKGNSKSPTDLTPWLTEPIQQAFVRFVEEGRGLLVVHSGAVGYAGEPLFRHLAGGGFRHHPVPCPVQMEYNGNPATPEFIGPAFSVQDEHYLMDLYHQDLQMFLTSTSPAGTEPAGWIRQQGQGRVCVLTPGHYKEVWLHPEYQNLLRNAVYWCAGKVIKSSSNAH